MKKLGDCYEIKLLLNSTDGEYKEISSTYNESTLVGKSVFINTRYLR
jgi:hypothetical protein